MATRNGLELDLELIPGEKPERPKLRGSFAVVFGGERYGGQIAEVEADALEGAVKRFGEELAKVVRGEPHGLGGRPPQWQPGEREMITLLVEGEELGEDDELEPGGSSCCGAPLTLGGDLHGGTAHAVCTKCGQPADGVASAT